FGYEKRTAALAGELSGQSSLAAATGADNLELDWPRLVEGIAEPAQMFERRGVDALWVSRGFHEGQTHFHRRLSPRPVLHAQRHRPVGKPGRARAPRIARAFHRYGEPPAHQRRFRSAANGLTVFEELFRQPLRGVASLDVVVKIAVD